MGVGMKGFEGTLAEVSDKLERTGMYFLVLAIVCASFGIFSFAEFLDADYFVYNGEEQDWTASYGYTYAQFAYFFFGCYFFPISIIFMLMFVSESFLNTPPQYEHVKAPVYLALMFTFMAGVIVSYEMGQNVLNCIWYFCIGGPDENEGTSAGTNFMAMVYFFVSFIFMGIFFGLLCMLGLEYYRTSKVGGTVAEMSGLMAMTGMEGGETEKEVIATGESFTVSQYPKTPSRTGKPSVTLKITIICLVFLGLYPLLLLACMLLPTWWSKFTHALIEAYQNTLPSQSVGTYAYYVFPSGVAIKLYPDIGLFYGFIYAVCGVALLAAVYPDVRKALIARPKWLRTFSVGQVLMASGIVILCFSIFFYFYYDHGWEDAAIDNTGEAERTARSLGQVSNVLLGLLLLTQAKNSIWTYVFGMGWEEMLVWHQSMAYAYLVVILAHTISWWCVFAQDGYFPENILRVPSLYHEDNFTIPLAQFTFMIAIVVFGVFTFYKIRRNLFELFYYSHTLFVPIWILVVLWHSTMSWYYMIGALVFLTVDIVIRLMTTVGTQVTLKDASVAVPASLSTGSGITQIAYTVRAPGKKEQRPLCHEMGQYAWLNVPEIDPVAWHPFTISSAPLDGVTTHHIRNMGDEEWTGMLYSLAAAHEADGVHMQVNVDGPYGGLVGIENYTDFLMIAGGIGVTPIHSIVRQLYFHMKAIEKGEIAEEDSPYKHIQRVRLIWAVKTEAESQLFLETFDSIAKDSLNGKFSIQICVTTARGSNRTNGKDAANVEGHRSYGIRPNIAEEVKNFASKGEDALAFVCGPEVLVRQVEALTIDAKIHFKQEYFLW
jgi:predicted ferric reductase